MIDFFTHKVLFASTFDVSFGDAITNAYWAKYFFYKFKLRAQIHCYINEKTYEKVGWFLHNYHPCDRVFIHPCTSTIFIKEKFENLGRDYYDIVIIDHVYGDLLGQLKLFFTKAEFLTGNPTIHNKLGIPLISKKYESTNFIEEYSNGFLPFDLWKQYDEFDKILTGRKFVAVFPCSTRVLSSLNYEGVQKVIDFAKSKNMVTVLCGESFDSYTTNSTFQKSIREVLERCTDESVINLMGLGIYKICKWIEKAEYIFYGPTGSSMLGIYDMSINPNSYLLNAGDSSIMRDIYNQKPKYMPLQKMNVLTTSCPFFPCGRFSEEQASEKVKRCRDNKRASCLNEELIINI